MAMYSRSQIYTHETKVKEMRRYFPIIISLVVITLLGYVVIQKKDKHTKSNTQEKVSIVDNIGSFETQKTCARLPSFLKSLHISQPVMIDLSQKHFKGIALLHGQQFSKAMHPKQWEQYGHFGTYTLDKEGNIFLVPMPYISIKPTTFNLQKNIYRLDSHTGKIEIFMHFDNVHPSPRNPYGINAITFDCDDNTLWVAAIDETDYQTQRGVIYHIDIQTKRILSQIEGTDVLTLSILKNKKSKYLLAGGARENVLYAYDLHHYQAEQYNPNFKPVKLFTLPVSNEYIRKIKIKDKNHLRLETIPFSYTLITQTSKEDRKFYDLFWEDKTKKWVFSKIE